MSVKIKSRMWMGDTGLRYAHEKIDGHWLRIERKLSGAVMTTSRPTDITDQLSQYPFYIAANTLMPYHQAVLGELYVPSVPASQVKTYLVQKSSSLRFRAFAIETQEPGLGLELIEELCTSWGFEFAKFLRRDQHFGDWPPPIREDTEGWVMKNGNLLDWQKIKDEKTIDLIVDSFTDGAGKFLGLVGSVVCRTTEGQVVANVSGMDDETRVDMTLNEESWVGRVVEVEYQYVGSRGRLRHPRFVRLRDDKTPDECSVSQDPALAKIWKTINL